MMQDVATTKSEVAAFATSVESKSLADTGSNAQFGQILQDEKAIDPVVVVKSKTSVPQGPSKNPSQQPIDEGKIDSPVLLNDDTNTQIDDTDTQNKNTANQNDKKTTGESSEVLAEEWVLLINNLKRLAGNDRSPISSLEEFDVAATDLKLSDKAEKALFALLSDGPSSDNSSISLDEFTLPPAADIKDPNAHVLVTDAQAELNISELVDKALVEAIDSVKVAELPKAEIMQKTAEILLDQPLVLQELISQLRNSSQKSDSAEQNTVDTTINNVIKKEPRLAKQQLESVGQADLTLDENKNLLRALVAETEAVTDTNNTKVPVKLAKAGVSDTAEKLELTHQTEVAKSKVESVVDSGELLEQEVQMTQVATSNPLKDNKTDKALANHDVKSLLNLTDSKLDKVLENIAQRVFESKITEGSTSPEPVAQQVVPPKTADIMNSIESSSKDFIAALKSGLEEFKNQLSQGREPGIDLKALVAEALAKTTDPATATVAKAPVNLEKIVNSVAQVADLAQFMSRTIEERHDQVYSATLRDVAQIQGEQSKQIQLNQVESKFEKAINIAKPEGHQQLAEKVRWMVNTKNLVAEIRLDPAELGSVHVKVAMSGESATVNFVVQSQQARDAVDTATPRLREMLAEKGIELGQSSVRQESDGQQSQGDSDFAKQGGGGNDESENLEVSEQVIAQQNIVNGVLGGIDYFV